MEPHNLVSHESLTSLFKISIDSIIKNDPFLKDLNSNTTLEELNNLLSLEHGDSMILYVHRADNQIINVIVKQNAKVKDLKAAITRHMQLKFQREPHSGPKILNWKYTWKRYCLCFNDTRLCDDNKLLKDYDVHNKSQITFGKNLRDEK